jgi:carbonic anhydrase
VKRGHPLFLKTKQCIMKATDKIAINTKDMTPADALHLLKEGNFRFINNMRYHRDLLDRVNETKDGQFPFAAILSCMDSRAPAELIFDQGLGDIFSIRIAGNVVTTGILGSLEYATAVAGSKLILVLGHTSCGAIKGACDDVQMGNLTSLLAHIRPAVELENTVKTERNSSNVDFVDKVTLINVYNSVDQIIEDSQVIRELVHQKKVALVPALYDVGTGRVRFYPDEELAELESASTATVVD